MLILRFFQGNTCGSFGFSEYVNGDSVWYDRPVEAVEGKRPIAKQQDSNPNPRRLNRRIAGGSAKRVNCTYDGIMPGMRGLQHGASQNKRVVTLGDDYCTRQILPKVKTYQEKTAMHAKTAMGIRTRKPSAQPLRTSNARIQCKPTLTLQDIFLSLDELGCLSQRLNTLSVTGATLSEQQTLTAALDRGVDDLRVKVFAMLEAQGGVQ